MTPKLFLLNPNFQDENIGNITTKYYCPHSAFLEGILSYYPDLKNQLDINYVNFKRPRIEVINFLGEANQNCPSLIIKPDAADYQTTYEFKKYSKFLFSNDTRIIAKYLARKFGIGIEHP